MMWRLCFVCRCGTLPCIKSLTKEMSSLIVSTARLKTIQNTLPIAAVQK